MRSKSRMPFGNGTSINSIIANESKFKNLDSNDVFDKKMSQFKREVFGFFGSRYNSNAVIKDFEYFDSVLKSLKLSNTSIDSRLFLESISNQGAEFYDNSFKVKKCYLHAQKILDSSRELYKVEFSKPTNPLFYN